MNHGSLEMDGLIGQYGRDCVRVCAVQAIAARDYPLLQGCILVIAFSYVLVNLVTDFIYVLADPRVRLQ